jgi:hypothetical protein
MPLYIRVLLATWVAVTCTVMLGCSCDNRPLLVDASVSPDAAWAMDAWSVDAAEDTHVVDTPLLRSSCDSVDTRQLAACAAAVRTACAPHGGRMDATEALVLEYFGFDMATRDCLISAGSDCALAQECIGDRLEPGGCLSACEGSIRTDGLLDGWCRYIDCARSAPGNTCLMYDSMNPFDPPVPVCTTTDCLGRTGRSCLGDDVEQCAVRTTRTVTVCEDTSPCRVSGGVADCLPEGASCTDGTAPRCRSATELEYCAGGRLGTLDCSVMGGGRCVMGPGGPDCMYDEVLCDDTGTRSTTLCDGNDLVYCYYGQFSRVNCLDLGFTRCGTFGGLPTCLPVAEGRVP